MTPSSSAAAPTASPPPAASPSAGRSVLLLEAGASVGGAARTVEFAPGYRVSAVAHLLNLLDPRVEAGLDLARHGLAYLGGQPRHHRALGDRRPPAPRRRLRRDVCGASPDSAAWATLRARLLRYAGALKPFKELTPPRLARGAGNETAKLAMLGLKLARHGPRRPARVPARSCSPTSPTCSTTS